MLEQAEHSNFKMPVVIGVFSSTTSPPVPLNVSTAAGDVVGGGALVVGLAAVVVAVATAVGVPLALSEHAASTAAAHSAAVRRARAMSAMARPPGAAHGGSPL
jgi:hypothetical protein